MSRISIIFINAIYMYSLLCAKLYIKKNIVVDLAITASDDAGGDCRCRCVGSIRWFMSHGQPQNQSIRRHHNCREVQFSRHHE